MPGYITVAIIGALFNFLILFSKYSKTEEKFGKCAIKAIAEVIGGAFSVFITVWLVYITGISLPGLYSIFSQWTIWQAFCAVYILYILFYKMDD